LILITHALQIRVRPPVAFRLLVHTEQLEKNPIFG